LDEQGIFVWPLIGEEGEEGGSAAHQAESSNVEYAPVTQRASKAAHMGHKTQRRAIGRDRHEQPHRDPDEQSNDVNPKKMKEEEVFSRPKATGINQKEKK